MAPVGNGLEDVVRAQIKKREQPLVPGGGLVLCDPAEAGGDGRDAPGERLGAGCDAVAQRVHAFSPRACQQQGRKTHAGIAAQGLQPCGSLARLGGDQQHRIGGEPRGEQLLRVRESGSFGPRMQRRSAVTIRD